MTKRIDYERRLIDELELHGIHEYEIQHGGKHLKLCFHFNGKDRKFIYPASPSDRRGLQNSLTDLRKLMGVKRIVRKNPDRPVKRKPAKLVLDCPRITTKPDPFAALAARAEELVTVAQAKPPIWRRIWDGIRRVA